MMAQTSKTLRINGRFLELSHPDKLYFPQDGLKKEDVVDYYRRIAQVMLPHLQERPLSLQRFPEGIAEDGFYQKEAPDYFPDWIKRVLIRVEGEGETQLVWEELDRPDLHSQSYTMRNIFRRLGQRDDPWREINENGRSLPVQQVQVI